LIQQKGVIQAEVMRIKNQQPELNQLRKQRTELLKRLEEIREQITTRRKAQLSTVNQNLRKVIEDYAVNLYYEPSGIVDEFKSLVLEVMHGTYFPEETARMFCAQVSPGELAKLIRKQDVNSISKIANIGSDWASKIAREFKTLTCLHALEATSKPPQPIIKVLTRGTKPKQLNVNQLSDGQKHTILLTIAMLAESNDPLIMDQPEDDLDNAFIFRSVVSTLRAIKESRQVILVTHNANIAVLGDSELLFPMRRTDDLGAIFDRGSVDRHETKQVVQDILEGGELAFRRRKEIYGH
jgi:ABC-type lipoprotein export system ATPase subunit